ncbi:energy transducer TonB [Cognatiluteimonas lumbrici]|uniref:hypothetical protein n=1 Tax=Cognatiluteimonas lumbrici TaxID=2559601 RepID=UPI0011264154|nr:hypothetical protein [Luteimonas lumbrici]
MGKHWKLVALVAGSAMLGAVSASDTFPGKDTVVASEGRIGDRWMLAEGATLATPAYPAHLAGRGDDVCVALGYRILPDGSTTDFAVLKQWTSAGEGQQDDYWRAFAEAGADALSQWRFQPRPGVVARSTYTVATLAFSAASGQATNTRAHCEVGDLAAFLQQTSSRAYMASRERRDAERLLRGSQRPAMVENPGRPRNSSQP